MLYMSLLIIFTETVLLERNLENSYMFLCVDLTCWQAHH